MKKFILIISFIFVVTNANAQVIDEKLEGMYKNQKLWRNEKDSIENIIQKHLNEIEPVRAHLNSVSSSPIKKAKVNEFGTEKSCIKSYCFDDDCKMKHIKFYYLNGVGAGVWFKNEADKNLYAEYEKCLIDLYESKTAQEYRMIIKLLSEIENKIENHLNKEKYDEFYERIDKVRKVL